jgi:hypothetical protein
MQLPTRLRLSCAWKRLAQSLSNCSLPMPQVIKVHAAPRLSVRSTSDRKEEREHPGLTFFRPLPGLGSNGSLIREGRVFCVSPRLSYPRVRIWGGGLSSLFCPVFGVRYPVAPV